MADGIDETDQHPLAAPDYSYRPSLLGGAWEFRLTPTALVYGAGHHTGRIPYDQIRRVRLSFRPSTMQSQRFLAEIWSDNAPKLIVSSSSWKSMVEHERKDAEYSRFIRALHARLASAGTSVAFIGGTPPLIYWPGLIVFVIVALGLAALIVRGLQDRAFSATAIIAALFVFFFWQLGQFFRRNRPIRYDAQALPRELLPRD
jgi:hypothetical protein